MSVSPFARPQIKKAIEERYVVNPATRCWEWTGRIHKGYPWLRLHKNPDTRVQAHRHVYELHRGPIPSELQLDHVCRNTRCVNPDHLEPVTCVVNVRRGDRVKLNPAAVAYIRWLALRDCPPTDRQLGEYFGVVPTNVRSVRIGDTWREIQPLEPPEPLKSMPRIGRRHARHSLVGVSSSSVVAWESSSVEARESSSVVAWGSATVIKPENPWGNPTITVADKGLLVDRSGNVIRVVCMEPVEVVTP
jgi:HNH endonuclease